MVRIPDLRDHLPDQLIDAGILRASAVSVDHGGEVVQRLTSGWPELAKQLLAASGIEPGGFRPPGDRGERLKCRVAESAARNGDGTAECFVVRRIGDQLQVRHEVANLAA